MSGASPSQAAALQAWREEIVFQDGDSYFADLLEGIAAARVSIDLESYIFQPDVLGTKVLDALAAAGARGVRVRLLVDGVGAPSFDERKVAMLQYRGIQARVYHPLPWVWFRLSAFLHLLLRLNRRDHRKLCLIDSAIAWVGSMNISAEHLRSLKGEDAWRDTATRVQGPGIDELQRAFDRAWLRGAGARRPRGVERTGRAELLARWTPARLRRPGSQSAWIRLNASRSARRRYFRDLLRRVSGAKRRVWITNAYFAPDLLLMRALRVAAWGGADVRVLVPRKSDVFFMPWITEAFYQQLLNAGVRVYEYLPSFLHAKTMLIDDWATVGSSNLNHRSMLHDLEIDLVLGQPASLRSLAENFENDLARSREVSRAEWRGLPLSHRAVAKFLLFFRYFI
ncbi:MAG: phosphatidylserine/phosphatidylglycerophosphate/cardiolipin synthase family protein [Oligoflexia bacterium]|nr:phosphatidylserine/phosphatidylglycerophosphate/cardiolipin synthase family protein [Oligoflexia bacterium]